MLNAIIQIASSNSSRQFAALDKISTNVANYNTTAYKAQRFEQYLTPDGRLDGAGRVDLSSGDAMLTKRELDIAISGDGFIPITQPDGTTAYTRDGSFVMNGQGYLVTPHGDMVGDGIQVPLNHKQVQIKSDGTVLVQTEKGGTFSEIGHIGVVRFTNAEELKNIGYNKMLATDLSGEPSKDTQSMIKQGFLERSNVNVYSQIEQVLRLNASLISNMRIIKFADQIYQQAVNLKQ